MCVVGIVQAGEQEFQFNASFFEIFGRVHILKIEAGCAYLDYIYNLEDFGNMHLLDR